MDMQVCPDCGCHFGRFARLEYGNIIFDGHGLVIFEGVEVELPRSQYVVLEALVRAQGCGLTRSALAIHVGEDINDETIAKYIERIRKNFQKIVPIFDQIISLKGFGAYRWRRKEPNFDGRHFAADWVLS